MEFYLQMSYSFKSAKHCLGIGIVINIDFDIGIAISIDLGVISV